MDCGKCRLLISREIDGIATPAESSAAARHVDSCASCASFRELARRSVAIHRALPSRVPSARLVASICAAAAGARVVPWPGRWLRFALPAAAAAVFILGFWVGNLMRERYGGEEASTLAAGAAAGLELEYLDECPPGSFGNIFAASYEGGGQ